MLVIGFIAMTAGYVCAFLSGDLMKEYRASRSLLVFGAWLLMIAMLLSMLIGAFL